MQTDIETVVALLLILLMTLVFIFRAKNKANVATLVERQELKEECAILTFAIKSGNKKLNLKVGEQISIGVKDNPEESRKYFTPISIANGSFKILYVPSIECESDNKTEANRLLSKLKVNEEILYDVVKSNFKYLGNSIIQVILPKYVQSYYSKKLLQREFKDVFILSQGSKTQITYQIVKGIVEEPNSQKPAISILFAAGSIGDFALKEQFSELEENNENLKYYYTIPMKGERQPTLAGLGISSEKINQSFHTDPNDTFCIICADESELSVVVERSLLNKQVPAQHIFKY